MNHFLLFHTSCRMLSSKNALLYSTIARDYLHKFVEASIVLYGEKFVSLNVHYLYHLVDDVDNNQCDLNDISAFTYESELGRIKNILLSPNKTIAQYFRRIHEEREILDLQAKPFKELLILRRGVKNAIILLKYKEQYISNKHPDNTVILKNGNIVTISKIFLFQTKIYLQVRSCKIKKSVYTSPCDSRF